MFRLKNSIQQIKNGNSILRRYETPQAKPQVRVARVMLERSHSTARHIIRPPSCSSGRNLRLGLHVKEALANDEPIVALESTVITHGMPEPENRNLAHELEKIVLAQDCVPATIGIISGQLVIGLTLDEIDFLSRRELCKPMKASRRDIPIALALKRSAGTTVAGTMSIVCSLQSSPIKVFATGGTGGVHKGGESSMDISADLFEFSRSPMGVVSSGFKSFLDTRRSLEYLETIGCTVMSLRESSAEEARRQLFPAFYSTENDEQIESPLSVASIEKAARILYECLESRFAPPAPSDRRGALIAVPIPRQFSLDNLSDQLRAAVEEIEARQDLQGFEKTPLILARLNEITNGQSLAANVELLKNNARVGAQLAREYNKIQSPKFKPTSNLSQSKISKDFEVDKSILQQKPLVIGCTMIDMHVSTKMDLEFRKNAKFSGVTFKGRPHLSVGGVGRNLAVALEYLGCSPRFVTALANDSLGQFAHQNLRQVGLVKPNSPLIRITPKEGPAEVDDKHGDEKVSLVDAASSCFALVLRDSSSGQCEYVIANLDIINKIGRHEIMQQRELIANARLVVLDANLNKEAIETTVKLCFENSRAIFIEPTDCLAIPRLIECLRDIDREKPDWLSSLVCMTPNLIEFQMMAKNFFPNEGDEMVCDDGSTSWGDQSQEDTLGKRLNKVESLARKMMQEHLKRLKCLVITLDKDGVFVVSRVALNSNGTELLNLNDPVTKGGHLYSKYFQVPEQVSQAISGSGAGDSFAAGFIARMIRESDDSSIEQCIQFGFKSARLALMDEDTIPRKLIDLQKDMNAGNSSVQLRDGPACHH